MPCVSKDANNKAAEDDLVETNPDTTPEGATCSESVEPVAAPIEGATCSEGVEPVAAPIEGVTCSEGVEAVAAGPTSPTESMQELEG